MSSGLSHSNSTGDIHSNLSTDDQIAEGCRTTINYSAVIDTLNGILLQGLPRIKNEPVQVITYLSFDYIKSTYSLEF